MNTAQPNPPGLLRALGLVAAFGARQICWSRRTLFMGLVLLAPAGMAVIVRAAAPPGVVETLYTTVLPHMLLSITQLLVLFYAASLVRDGMEDHTIVFLLTKPLGRVRIVLGLWIGMVLFTLPLALIAAGTATLACRAGLPTEPWWSEVGATAVARLALGVTMVVLVHGALYTAFGLIFRYPTIVGLVYLIVGDIGIGFLPGPARLGAPTTWVEFVLRPAFKTRADIPELDSVIFGTGPAIGFLCVALVGLLALIARLSKRKDFIVFEKGG